MTDWAAYFRNSEFRNMRTATITPESIAHYTTPVQCRNLVRFCTREHKYWMVLRGEFPRWQLGYIYEAARRLGVSERIHRNRFAQEVMVCPKIRTDGHPCKAQRMPGEETCYWHRP